MNRSRRPRLSGLFVAVVLLGMIVRVPEAPATVAEQRARLPPAAECEREVEGKWKALVYQPYGGDWYEWTLEIHQDRTDATVLTGMMYVDVWSGPPEVSEPGPCSAGITRQKGKMPSTGSFIDGKIAFDGGDYERVETVCGSGFGGYNPDHFTGKIEPERQEFQSFNNDGGISVDQYIVFRRIGCFDDEPLKPAGDVKPPPFYPKPKKSVGGCL